eukprot:1139967-Pelagomonas_calceolata.AAC.4
MSTGACVAVLIPCAGAHAFRLHSRFEHVDTVSKPILMLCSPSLPSSCACSSAAGVRRFCRKRGALDPSAPINSG